MILDDTSTADEVANAIRLDIVPFENYPINPNTLVTIRNLIINRLRLAIDAYFIFDYVLLNAKGLVDADNIGPDSVLRLIIGIKVKKETDFIAVPISLQLSRDDNTKENQ